MDEDQESLSTRQAKVVTVIAYTAGIFFVLNLYVFLEVFFKVVLPNFGKGTFFHYVRIVLILSIAACVIETIKRRRNALLFISFTLLLLIVNVYAIWRNWFYH